MGKEPDDIEEEVAEPNKDDLEFDDAFDENVEKEEKGEEKGEPEGEKTAEEKAAAEKVAADEKTGDEAPEIDKLDMDGLKKHIEEHPDLKVEVKDDATEESLRKAITEASPAGEEAGEEDDPLAKLDLDGLKKHIKDNKIEGIEITDETKEEDLRKAIEDASESEEDKADRERGEKLIKDEDDRKKAVTEAEEDKKKKAAAAKDESTVLAADRIEIFTKLVTEDQLPDKITVGGEEFKLKEYFNDFPEVGVISGLMTQKILERLVENKTLSTVKSMEAMEDRIGSELFDLRVLQAVSDAQEIVDSDKYKAWAKTAAKETKALLRSEDPKDFIKGLQQFKRSVAKKLTKPKKVDEKKKKKKKDHDELHGSTLRPSGKSSPSATGAGGKEDFDSAFDEAADKEDTEK